ncbi:hypothetical protein ACLKA7_003545 [Drosophila subpalustris]
MLAGIVEQVDRSMTDEIMLTCHKKRQQRQQLQPRPKLSFTGVSTSSPVAFDDVSFWSRNLAHSQIQTKAQTHFHTHWPFGFTPCCRHVWQQWILTVQQLPINAVVLAWSSAGIAPTFEVSTAP